MAVALNLLSLAISIYTWVVLAWVIAGWLVVFRVVNPNNGAIRTVLRVLEGAVEPVLGPIRRLLPRTGGIDFSPLILVLGLWAVQSFLIPALFRAAYPTGVA